MSTSEVCPIPASGSTDHLNGHIICDIVAPKNDLQQLFERVIVQPTSETLRQFLRQAREAQVDMKEYERYLTCFEKASILTTKEKGKQLFLHACSLLLSDRAQNVIDVYNLDRKQLLRELHRSESTPSFAFGVLCKSQMTLDNELATIPMLMRLIHAEVDVNLVVIEGLHPVEWILKQNESLVQELLSYSSSLSPTLFKSEIVKAFVAKKLQCTASNITCVQITKTFKEFGARFIDGNEALFSHACTTDDVELAESLLNDGLEPTAQFEGSPLLLFACQKPNAYKVTELLLAKGVDVNASHQVTKKTPLSAALKNGNAPICLVLIQNGANFFLEDSNGETPFQLMSRSDDEQIRHLALQPDILLQPWEMKAVVQNLKSMHQKSPPSPELLQLLSSLVIAQYDSEKLNTPEGLELFSEFVRLKAFNAIEASIENGLTIYKSRETSSLHFSDQFIMTHSEVFTFLVERAYLDQDTKSVDLTPLVFIVSSEHPQTAKLHAALLKKGAKLHVKNKKGDTLLHHYAKNKVPGVKENLQLILASGLDVNTLDIDRRPALYYVLGNKTVDYELADFLLANGAHPFHLSDRMMKYVSYVQHDRAHLLFKDFKICQGFSKTFQQFYLAFKQNCSKYPEEALEIVFLWPGIAPLKGMFKTKSEYLSALANLHKKYPAAPPEYFYPFLMELNHGHLKRKTLDFKIPDVKGPVDIKNLLLYFDALNWQNASSVNYYNPNEVKIAKHTFKRENLRSALQKLLFDYVPRHEAFTGTPAAGTRDLAIFYNNLENLLKHLVLLLDAEQDPARRAKSLLKLAWSALYCGTRWEDTALRLYQKLKFKKTREDLLEDKFDEHLAILRGQIISDFDQGNIHVYAHYVKTIGDKYNIPLAQGVPKVSETHQPQNLSPEICERNFNAFYNASVIIPSTLTFFELSIRKNDGVLLRWFKNQVPVNFSYPGYKELCWATKCLDLFYKDPQQHRAAVQHLFRSKDIPLRSDFSSAEETLQGMLQQEYFDTRVYDTEKAEVLHPGLIHFLHRRGVLTEHFQGIFSDFVNMWKKS